MTTELQIVAEEEDLVFDMDENVPSSNVPSNEIQVDGNPVAKRISDKMRNRRVSVNIDRVNEEMLETEDIQLEMLPSGLESKSHVPLG